MLLYVIQFCHSKICAAPLLFPVIVPVKDEHGRRELRCAHTQRQMLAQDRAHTQALINEIEATLRARAPHLLEIGVF